mgnify:CR=1 FL=1
MEGDRPGTFAVDICDANGAHVLTATGELDIAGASQVLDAVPDAIARPIIFDLSGVTFMDSSGLRSLLGVREACENAGQELRLARPSEAVLRVLTLVDIVDEFTISGAEAP